MPFGHTFTAASATKVLQLAPSGSAPSDPDHPHVRQARLDAPRQRHHAPVACVPGGVAGHQHLARRGTQGSALERARGHGGRSRPGADEARQRDSRPRRPDLWSAGRDGAARLRSGACRHCSGPGRSRARRVDPAVLRDFTHAHGRRGRGTADDAGGAARHRGAAPAQRSVTAACDALVAHFAQEVAAPAVPARRRQSATAGRAPRPGAATKAA